VFHNRLGGTRKSRTICVYCATSEITSVISYPPAAVIDFRSAAVPAPPDGSVAAIDRTRGTEEEFNEVMEDIPSLVQTRAGSTGCISALIQRTPCPQSICDYFFGAAKLAGRPLQ